MLTMHNIYVILRRRLNYAITINGNHDWKVRWKVNRKNDSYNGIMIDMCAENWKSESNGYFEIIDSQVRWK